MIPVTVTDDNGVAVEGETMTITEGGGSEALQGATASTDETGVATFDIGENTAGTYQIKIEDETGDFTSRTTVTVEAHSEGVTNE
jgi:hypothetical protein